VVNLTSNTVTATIPATSVASATEDVNTTPTEAYGHPTTIAATSGTPTGKVYVTSSDNKFMTVIETDTDTVTTHVNLQGLGVRVVVTAQ
jgi:YVTN family beta-propeller protein